MRAAPQTQATSKGTFEESIWTASAEDEISRVTGRPREEGALKPFLRGLRVEV